MSRFIITRTDKKIPSETKEVIKKIIKAESKTISKVRKKAKLQKVNISQIHEQLMLYAMRTHLQQFIKDFREKKYL